MPRGRTGLSVDVAGVAALHNRDRASWVIDFDGGGSRAL